MNGFYVPTKIYTGESAFENLKKYPIRSICIICDPFVATSGMIKKPLDVLESMGAACHVFSDITPDPSTDLVGKGVSWILEKKPDTIMAMGGGSAIDAAKAISFMYQQITKAERPLCIVAPTTSGTGSEVTNFAVITDSDTHIKYPLLDDKLLPRIHPGAIVLLHSTSSTNAAILDELLSKWEEMGYTFGKISDLCTA